MLNLVQLIGHLGRDAELRYTTSGAPVSNWTMATTDKWTDKNGERQEKTEWHRCVWWGKGAEAVNPYLTKGKQVYVQGSLETRQWDDKDGNKRTTTEIKVRQLTLLGGGGGQRDEHDQTRGFEEGGAQDPIDNDPPF